MKRENKNMISMKKNGMKTAVLILAAVMTAGAVFSGAAAATSPGGGVIYYYENVTGFDTQNTDAYKYLNNIVSFSGMTVFPPIYEEGSYVNTNTSLENIDGFQVAKLDASIVMRVYDADDNVILYSINGNVPQGSTVSFEIILNLPTPAYSVPYGHVGLKFIGPDGSGESTFLGTLNYSAGNPNLKTKVKLDSNLPEGLWTVWAYFVPGTQAGFFAPGTPDEYLNGQKFSFTVISSTLAVSPVTTSAKVGGYVTITISGKPNDAYYLKPNEKYEVNHGQQNFDYGTNKMVIGKDGTTTLTLKAVDYGKFTLQLCSDSTMKVVEEELELRFIKAEITAAVEKESYYMGTDVKLTGTNEALYPLYYYIEGTNLKFRKIDESNLKHTKYSKEWETTIKGDYIKTMNLDTAPYTVFISNINETHGVKDNVINSSAVYTAVGINLVKPGIRITSAPSVVVHGDKLTIKGVADSATDVQYYIFGTNKFYNGTVDAGKNGAFTIEMTINKTDYDVGQYYVVLQHPMYDDVYNIAPVKKDGVMSIALNNSGQATPADNILFSLNERQSTNAAQALCDAIDSEDIDDICTKFSFIATAEGTVIDPIPSQIIKGLPFTVSGSTNRVDGGSVIVEMLSTAFSAASKYSATSASYIILTATPDENGKWAVTFNTDNLNIDEYTVTVTTETVKSNAVHVKVIEGDISINPVATETGAQTPTTVPVKPTEEAKSPGFGIAAVLAGLGAAVLLMRRA